MIAPAEPLASDPQSLPLARRLQVPTAHIQSLEMFPNVGSSSLRVTVHGSKAASGAAVKAVVTAKGKRVATAEGYVGQAFEVKLTDVQLWSPDEPFLYDFDVRLHPKVSHSLSSPLLKCSSRSRSRPADFVKIP